MCKETAMTKLLNEYRGYKGALIPVLQEAQNIYGYLPKNVLQQISRELDIPFSKVFGVCTFYAQFHLKPRGRNIIRVCLGTACHVRGGEKIFQAAQENLGVGPGGTTEDLRFTLETVACIGACGLSPCMMVNEDTHGRLMPKKVGEVLEGYK
ncbi:MAG TPA: NADH-quinone oxidoreductase subunit NuoE [Dissulfurispiraceae bacterium]|nr:NADH-quinone oxidoreductase subunit NuoE [Dissulfurispiraceae bacterium]